MAMEQGRFRRKAFLVVALGSLVLAAGCIGDDLTEEAPEEPGAGEEATVESSMSWWATDCQAVFAAVPVEADALEPYLPSGFTPLTPEAFGLPPDFQGDAVLGAKTAQCDDVATLDGSEPLAYGALWAPVEPPEEMEEDAALFHFVAWDTLVQDDDTRDHLHGWGLPVYDGHAGMEGFAATPAGYTFDVTLEMNGDTFVFQGVANAPEEDLSEPFEYVDFMPGDDGLAAWEMTSETTDLRAGTGVLKVPTGHWAEDVIGSEDTHAWMLADEATSFANGTILFP